MGVNPVTIKNRYMSKKNPAGQGALETAPKTVSTQAGIDAGLTPTKKKISPLSTNGPADQGAIEIAFDSVVAEIEQAGRELAKLQSKIAALKQDRLTLRTMLDRRASGTSAGDRPSLRNELAHPGPHHAEMLYVLEFPIPVWIGALAAVLQHDGAMSTSEIADDLTRASPQRWRSTLDATRIAAVLNHDIAGKLLDKPKGRNQPVKIRKGKTEDDVRDAITTYLNEHWPTNEIKARRR